MTPNPRQALLLDEVRERGSVTVEALAEQFGVTLQTVRRDVKLLADAGLLARFHGGFACRARPPRTSPTASAST
jgi:DeoR family glycerol-3-phosphate regulon repressor